MKHYDIIGNFLLPESVKKANLSYKKGIISYNKLKEAQDNAIRNLIIKQKEYEFPFIYDGHYRRENGTLDFIIPFLHVNYNEEGLFLKGPLTFKSHPLLEEFRFIHSFEDENSHARISIPSPSTFIHIFNNKENILKYYDSLDDFNNDVISIYRSFIKEIYHAGCRYLLLEEEALDYLEETVHINNEVIDNQPQDLIFSTHIQKNQLDYDSYNKIAAYLFTHEHVHSYYIECDHKSSYPLAFLSHLPSDKDVILRLLVANTPFMENEEEIINRVIEASLYVPLSHLSISTRGEFDTSSLTLSEFQQWEKIQKLKDISEKIWHT